VLAAVDSIAPIPVAAAASKDPQTAQHQSTQETRTADVDTRAWASNHVAPSAEQIRDLSLLPHAHANWSEGRGLPSTLFSDDGYLTAASNASPESIAKGFLRAHRALFRLSADENGANVLRLTNNWPAIDATPSWSPDGSQLAFTTTINGQIQLFEITADGSGQTQITTNPAVNALPTWCCAQAP
jgi:hypothetical protein